MKGLFAAIAGALVAQAAASTNVYVTQDTCEIECNACKDGGSYDFINSLVLTSRGFYSGSHNLASYELLKCSPNRDALCEFDSDFEVSRIGDGPQHEKDIVNYIDGIAIYAAIPLLCAIIVPFTLFCICFWRCCCCCCKGGCCCKRWPTRSGKCTMGYKLSTLRYSIWSKTMARCLVISYAIVTIVMIILGFALGGDGMVTATRNFVDAVNPSSTEEGSLMHAFRTAPRSYMKNLLRETSDAIAGNDPNNLGFIRDLNATVLYVPDEGFTIAQTNDNIQTVLDTLNNLPDAPALKAKVDEIETYVGSLSTQLTTLHGDVGALQTDLVTLQNKALEFSNTISQVTNLDTVIDANQPAITDDSNNVTSSRDGFLSHGEDARDLATVMADHWLSTSDADTLHTVTDNLRSSINAGDVTTWCGIADDWAPVLNMSFAEFDNALDAVVSLDGLKTPNNDFNGYINGLQAIADALSLIPDSFTAFEDAIAEVRDAGDEVDVSGLVSQLNALKAELNNLPSLTLIYDEINKVKDMKGTIDALLSLADDLRFVNASLVSLPDALFDIVDETPTINSTYYQYRGDLDSYEAEVQNLEAEQQSQLNKLNPYIDQAIEASSNITQLNEFNSTSAESDIEPIITLKASLSFDTHIPALTALQAAIDTTSYDYSTIAAAMETLRSRYDNLKTTFFAIYDNCDNTGSLTTSMFSDFYDEFDPVYSALPGSPSFNDVQSTFDSMHSDFLVPGTTAVTDVVAPSIVLAALPNLKSAALNAKPSTSSLNSDILSLRQQADPANADLPGVQSTIVDVNATITAFDFSVVKSAVTTLEDRVSIIEDYKDTLDEPKKLFNFLVEWTRFDLGPQLDAIAGPALDAAFASGGLEAMVNKFTRGVDAIIQHMNNGQSSFNLDLNLTEMVEDVMPRLQAFDNDAYADEGLIFFMLRMAFGDDSGDFVLDINEAKAGTVFKDASGNTRPGDKKCLSKTCLDNTLNNLFDNPVSDITAFDFSPPPIGVKYSTITYMPFIIPFVLMVFALLPAILCCGRKWQYHMSCCAVVCMCIIMPFLFYITALLTPFVMGFHDVCASGPNFAHMFVANSDMKLCTNFDGTYNAVTRECTVAFNPLDRSTTNVEVTFELGDVVQSVLGQCTANDPFARAFASVKDSAVATVDDLVDEQLHKEIDGLTLRPRVISLGERTGDRFETITGDFVQEVSDSIGCNTINTATTDILGAVCCDVGGAIYFSLVPWIGIVWAMCACGCTGSLLGAKRFPKEPWGAHYKEDSAVQPVAAAKGTNLDYENPMEQSRGAVAPHPQENMKPLEVYKGV